MLGPLPRMEETKTRKRNQKKKYTDIENERKKRSGAAMK